MAENRLTRELETREVTERPKQWMPADLLPEPDKQAGFAVGLTMKNDGLIHRGTLLQALRHAPPMS